MTAQKIVAVFLAWSCLVSQVGAQESQQVVNKPHKFVLLRPYLPAEVPPVRLTNSDRLHGLIRGGKLYLTVQDANQPMQAVRVEIGRAHV